MRRTIAPTRANKTCLRLMNLETRLAPAVTWDGGGGDLNWHTALNWSNDAIPGPADDVMLNAPGNVNITYKSGNSTILSLDLLDHLFITGGSITVTGTTKTNDRGISAIGAGTGFTGSGPVLVNGGSGFVAQATGQINLPGLTTMDTPTGFGITFQADGAGSNINLPNLLSVSANGNGTDFRANGGGKVSLPLVSKVDPGNFEFRADGVGSQINMSGVTSINGSTPVVNRLTCINGGQVVLNPALSTINLYAIYMDTNAALPTAQFTTLPNCWLTVAIAVAPNFNALTNFNGSSFYATSGAKVTLPGLTSNGTGASIFEVYYRADGANSELTLPNMTSLKGNASVGLFLQGLNGGHLSIPNVATFDTGFIQVDAKGANSQVLLPSLSKYEFATTHGYINIATGGVIVPNAALTKLHNVNLVIDSATGFPTGQLTTFTSGDLGVYVATPNFNALTDITRSNVGAYNGAKVTLPLVTEINSIGTFLRYYKAQYSNSELNLPAVTTIITDNNGVEFDAFDSGRINLPALSSIDTGAVSLYAAGANSQLDASKLATFNRTDGANLRSFIGALNNGKLLTPAALTTSRVEVAFDATGGFTNLTNLDNGAGSLLRGTGTLKANVISAGDVQPAGVNASGVMTINGTFNQTATGQLTMDMYGTTVGTQYDQLIITGTAALAGTLAVNKSSYLPALGNTFQPLTAAAVTGFYSGFAGMNVNASVELTIAYGTTAVTLNAVPTGGPIVTAMSPAGSVPGTVGFLDFTYNEPLNGLSLQTGDVVVTGPGGPHAPTSVTHTGVNTFRANFTTLTAAGSYTVTVGPNITDAANNKMNHDGDSIFGEAADVFISNLNIGGLSPPRVVGVTINGAATQRSRVTSVAVAFDLPVTLPGNPAAAFTMKRQSDNIFAGLNATTSGNTVTLNFAGALAQSGSLADGRYTLTVLANQVTGAGGQLDGNGDGNGGDDYTFTGTPANGLFRHFGDADGNGTVNGNDFLAFRLAFLGTNAAFDFDGTGLIDGNDFLQFRLRFLQSV